MEIAMARIGIALSAALLVAGCSAEAPGPRSAAASGPRGPGCFNVRTATDFTPAGRDAIVVRAGGNRYFRLDILGTCLDIDFNLRVGLRSRSGSSWVCHDSDVEVIARSAFRGLDRCPVVGMRQLSDQEVEALRHPSRGR